MVIPAVVAGVERCVALPVAAVAAGGMGNAPLQAWQMRVSNGTHDAPATPCQGGSPVSAAAAWMPAARSRLVEAFDAVLGRGNGEATDGRCPEVDGERLRRRRPGLGGQGRGGLHSTRPHALGCTSTGSGGSPGLQCIPGYLTLLRTYEYIASLRVGSMACTTLMLAGLPYLA